MVRSGPPPPATAACVQRRCVDRRTGIINNSLGRQQAISDEVTKEVADIRDIDVQIAKAQGDQTTLNALNAQRTAIVSQLCTNAGELTGKVTISPNTQLFIDQECS